MAILPVSDPVMALTLAIISLAQASPAALLSVARKESYWEAGPSSMESMMTTLMPADTAFLTTGLRAVVSEGARTMALTPRSMADSTMLISSLTFDSDWGPRNVTESFGVDFLSSFWASKQPV